MPSSNLKNHSLMHGTLSPKKKRESNKKPKKSRRVRCAPEDLKVDESAIDSVQVELDRGFDPSVEFVTLEVGDPATLIHVHSNVLCQTSEFLQRKCKPEWAGAASSSAEEAPELLRINLTPELPNVVRIYVNWLYKSALPEAFMANGVRERNNMHTKTAHCELALCYAFGEKMMDRAFQNAVINAMGLLFAKTQNVFFSIGAEIVGTIYEGTPASSPARQFLIALYVSHAAEENLVANGSSAEGPQAFPQQFLWDLTRALVSRREPVDFGLHDTMKQFHLTE